MKVTFVDWRPRVEIVILVLVEVHVVRHDVRIVVCFTLICLESDLFEKSS